MHEEISKCPEDTERIGRQIAGKLRKGDIVGFTGGLGAGKTFIIQSICKALGITELVTSPTFTLVHEYKGSTKIAHFDCYRLRTPQDAELLGLYEYFDSQFICLIEWADKIKSILPDTFVDISLARIPGKPQWRAVSINGL